LLFYRNIYIKHNFVYPPCFVLAYYVANDND